MILGLHSVYISKNGFIYICAFKQGKEDMHVQYVFPVS